MAEPVLPLGSPSPPTLRHSCASSPLYASSHGAAEPHIWMFPLAQAKPSPDREPAVGPSREASSLLALLSTIYPCQVLPTYLLPPKGTLWIRLYLIHSDPLVPFLRATTVTLVYFCFQLWRLALGLLESPLPHMYRDLIYLGIDTPSWHCLICDCLWGHENLVSGWENIECNSPSRAPHLPDFPSWLGFLPCSILLLSPPSLLFPWKRISSTNHFNKSHKPSSLSLLWES